MFEAFRLGGWGMYPTAIAGVILVLTAARYAWTPARHRMMRVIALGVLTFLSASLGFVTGVIKTMLVADGDPRLITAGVGESLVNVGFGLVLLVFASIAIVAGTMRTRSGSGALVDPVHRA